MPTRYCQPCILRQDLEIKNKKKMTKGRKKRVKKVHPKNLLPLEMWVNLIFAPYLNLDQLVAVRRTCKTFYSHPRVEALFQQRISERFGAYEKKHWNKYVTIHPKNNPVPQGAFAFLLVEPHGRGKISLLLCSTKERVMNVLDIQFGRVLTNERLTCSFFERNKQSENCVFFSWRGLYVYGMNDVINNRIEKMIQKQFDELHETNTFFEVDEPQEGWKQKTFEGRFSKQRAVIDLYYYRHDRVFYHTLTTFDPTEQTILSFFIENDEE
jgi:hypothetical protein